MSFAYLPWYTGDYLRDTRGLSMAGHGCYLLLLAFCWDTKGPLPLDAEEIAMICGARNQEERATMDRVCLRYFVKMEDGWYNKRLQREIEKMSAISLKRQAAGFKGYQARAKQLPSKSLANASTPYQPHTIPTPSHTIKTQTDRRASRLPDDWQLPDEWRDWAVTVHKLTPQQAVRISLVFRDHWIAAPGAKGLKTNWLATWRNWIRRETSDA